VVHAAGWVPILEVDPDLAQRLPEATAAAAVPLLVAPSEWLDPGEWRPPTPADDDRSAHMGLLIIDGFVARRVDVLDRPVTELLGHGDLLLPWEPDRTEPFLAGARFEVLEPTRIAILDDRFTALLSRWPEIMVGLLGRAVSRSRAFALGLAISQITGIDLRLQAMLWHLASRWGAGADGATVIPVRLTHQLLASLISAQRPTVTRALRRLTDDGLVSRRDDGLLVVHGEPPRQFRHLRDQMD